MYGGQAEAAANTYTGAMIQLKNAFSEIQEAIGAKLAPKIVNLSKKLKKFAEEDGDKVVIVVENMTKFVIGLGKAFVWTGNKLGEMLFHIDNAQNKLSKFLNDLTDANTAQMTGTSITDVTTIRKDEGITEEQAAAAKEFGVGGTDEEKLEAIRLFEENKMLIDDEFRVRREEAEFLKKEQEAQARLDEITAEEDKKKKLLAINTDKNKNIFDGMVQLFANKKAITEQDVAMQKAATSLMTGFFVELSQTQIKSVEDAGRAMVTTAKNVAIKMIDANTEAAVMNALATVTPFWPTAIIAAAQAAILGLMARSAVSAINFAEGGVMPGASFSGDRNKANVNSGEMVLNSEQQANLFALANNGILGDGGNSDGVNTGGQGTFILQMADGTDLAKGIWHKQKEMQRTGEIQ